MFKNPGGTIKVFAIIFFILMALGSFIGGIVLWSDYENGVFALLTLGGPLFSYLICLFLYGFGELIENTAILVKQGEKQAKAQHEAPKAPDTKAPIPADELPNL